MPVPIKRDPSRACSRRPVCNGRKQADSGIRLMVVKRLGAPKARKLLAINRSIIVSKIERIVGKIKQIDKYNAGKPAFRQLCPLCGKKTRGRFVHGCNQFMTVSKGPKMVCNTAALAKQ